jgi:hypothetical protein
MSYTAPALLNNRIRQIHLTGEKKRYNSPANSPNCGKRGRKSDMLRRNITAFRVTRDYPAGILSE